ncbi:MAG: hypothetical protein QOC77_3065, partial [Thermoleophilaceae bacterium]|nr:hypothetical protein [Thermoleophilaceae bacterium]
MTSSLRPASTLCCSGVALLLLLAAGPAAAKTVRVFAMQPKLDLAWMQSRQTYHDKMFALADARLRGPGAPLVQRGAADAVWVDERERSADDDLPQAHVFYARVGQRGPGRRLDTGKPVTL